MKKMAESCIKNIKEFFYLTKEQTNICIYIYISFVLKYIASFISKKFNFLRYLLIIYEILKYFLPIFV